MKRTREEDEVVEQDAGEEGGLQVKRRAERTAAPEPEKRTGWVFHGFSIALLSTVLAPQALRTLRWLQTMQTMMYLHIFKCATPRSSLVSITIGNFATLLNTRPIPLTRAARMTRIFVGNLDRARVNDGTLIKIFQKFGKVLKAEVVHHRGGPLRGQPRGFAFIELNSPDEADAAIAALDGR